MAGKQKHIPDRWKKVELGSVVNHIKGFAFKSSDYTNDGKRIIRVSDLAKTTIKKNGDQIFIDQSKSHEYLKWSLKKGDLIFTTVGSKPPQYDSLVGRVIKVRHENEGDLLNQNAVILRVKDKSYINQLYLHNHFLTKRYIYFIESIIRGNANQGSITLEDLFTFPFILPPLPEQHRIIEVLEAWDRYLEKLDRKIAIKKQIKKGLMQQLLTGKKQLPGFSGEWKKFKLSNLGQTYVGIFGKDKDDFGKGKPFITYMNVYLNPSINTQITDLVNIVDGEKQNIAKYGDLFFTTSSETPEEVGISSVLLDKNAEGLYLNSFCFGFRLNNLNQLMPIFAKFYFRGQQFRKQMFRIAQGASRYNLSKKYFLELLICIPESLQEQTAIANILTAADEEITALGKKRSIIAEQKTFLLNSMITGELRLPEFRS